MVRGCGAIRNKIFLFFLDILLKDEWFPANICYIKQVLLTKGFSPHPSIPVREAFVSPWNRIPTILNRGKMMYEIFTSLSLL